MVCREQDRSGAMTGSEIYGRSGGPFGPREWKRRRDFFAQRKTPSDDSILRGSAGWYFTILAWGRIEQVVNKVLLHSSLAIGASDTVSAIGYHKEVKGLIGTDVHHGAFGGGYFLFPSSLA